MAPPSSGSRRSFADFINSLSSSSSGVIRDGFPLLGKLPREKFAALVSMGAQSAFIPHEIAALGAAEKLGLHEEDAMTVVGLANILTMTSSVKETPEQIAEILSEKFKLSQSDLAALKAFLQELQIREDEIASLRSRNRLAASVLPAFEYLETAIDIRVQVDDERVLTYVPVAIAYLRTDAAEERVWFQINKIQLTNLIKNLEKTLHAIEKAEEWSQRGA